METSGDENVDVGILIDFVACTVNISEGVSTSVVLGEI